MEQAQKLTLRKDAPTSGAWSDVFNISGAASVALAGDDGRALNNSTINLGGVSKFSNLTNWEQFLSNYGSVVASQNDIATGVFLQPFSGKYDNLIQQLHRVQSANYSFTVNRTDVNVFGQLARIDAIALEPPTVNLDFTYYPTDGFNERNLGFYIQGDGTR